ncbi:GNAT family N-acetyltransferase [Sphingomicrobium sp. XHP0235]|uniref:GNAT family N-acetyltransferase n=1 Tax=Sphingomicrobium aquimarinum TaxID=3133971 RepID=UPI0031FE62CD
MKLVVPGLRYLPSYLEALERGWSPDNVRGKEAADEQLSRIEKDADGFLASLDDPEGLGEPIRLPDGTLVPRLPSMVRWMWDGEFCGSIGFRWQRETGALPPSCLGHIGYAVVPWKRRKGHATAALAYMLDEARHRGLPYVDITTRPENLASRRVIVANGGTLIEKFVVDAAFGSREEIRFRIELEPRS